MRSSLLLAAGAGALVVAACSSAVKVRTSVAPDADLAALHTFHVLSPPARRAETPLAEDDPMLDNSITNRELRDELAKDFQARGYAPAGRGAADFYVAYYVGSKEKFDTTYWGPAWDPAWRYTYWGRPGWAWPWYAAPVTPWVADVQEYTEGQVVVDVVDSRTRQLLWRGNGVARTSDDPSEYSHELRRAADAVVKKFPAATARATADAGR